MRPASDPILDFTALRSEDRAALLANGLTTLQALIDHLPKRHEDRSRFVAFPMEATVTAVCLRGVIADVRTRRAGAGNRFVEAILKDPSGGALGAATIVCRWFNMPFIQKWVAAGQDVVVYGKVKYRGATAVIDQPELEVLDPTIDREQLHIGRIVPIYRNVQGISQRRLREAIFAAVREIDPASMEDGLNAESGKSLFEIYRALHFPEQIEEVARARRALALEEMFRHQLDFVRRRAVRLARPGRALNGPARLLGELYRALDFDFTGAQKRVIREVIADMRSPMVMMRLVQGDVGAGKTFVAIAAMLMAVDSGTQAAMMVPTQVLANQHFATCCRHLVPLGVRVALHTAERRELAAAADHPDSGEWDIVIGTHALLHGGIQIRDLGLVVIDEQHKFGVNQRAQLAALGERPDTLLMSATPIPRTLAMSLHGDMEISILDEKPHGRGRLVTGIRHSPKAADVTKFVKAQLAQGRQAILICPRIEDHGTSGTGETAVDLHARWQKRLPNAKVGLIHGNLGAEEKDAEMERFRTGGSDVLVATTVIEVGLDVPNATLMLVHDAERFGLAQLHQLRGRVGRGPYPSYCILLTKSSDPVQLKKLEVLARTNDGFVVAEEDLRMRGPGEMVGAAQSGINDYRFPEFLNDAELIARARELAIARFREETTPETDGNGGA